VGTAIVLLDLFSGTGGFAKGLLEAGYTFKKQYFSEIDKYAIANYKYNYKEAIYVGGVEEVKKEKGNIQKPNIVVFGSPCQDISIAGKRKGIQGNRSGLFFEAVRIVSEFQPDIVVFENVKGLFSSNAGKDFETVLQAFTDIGIYDYEWQLLNTAWFLPQNRERIYIVGHLRGKRRGKVFPIGENSKASETRRKGKIPGALTTTYASSPNYGSYIFHGNEAITGARTNFGDTTALVAVPLECLL